MISLSISGSSCSNVPGQSGYGELALDVVLMVFATLASQDVASVSLPVVPSSRLRFFKEGGVIDSRGGMFSLTKLKHSGSSKNQGLYSISVRLEGHGPESDVKLLSFFLGDNTLGSFLGLVFLSLVCFFHFSSLHFCVLY